MVLWPSRKEKRKKMPETTIKLQWKLLSKFSKEDQSKIINASIQNNWTGLFENVVKKSYGINNKGPAADVSKYAETSKQI